MVKLGVVVQSQFQTKLAETREFEGYMSEGTGAFDPSTAMEKKKPRTNLAVVVCNLASRSFQ